MEIQASRLDRSLELLPASENGPMTAALEFQAHGKEGMPVTERPGGGQNNAAAAEQVRLYPTLTDGFARAFRTCSRALTFQYREYIMAGL